MRISDWSSDVCSSDLVQQSQRHGGISGVEQRSLSLDHVPVIGRGIGAEHLRGPSFEVGYDGVHRHSPARDHDAGLPRGAKVGIHATLGESAGESKRRIFLAERAIRADRQQPLPAALAARSEQHTSELQSLMRISYAVLYLKKKIQHKS